MCSKIILKLVFEQIINLSISVSSFFKGQSKEEATSWWLLSELVKILLDPSHKFTQDDYSKIYSGD